MKACERSKLATNATVSSVKNSTANQQINFRYVQVSAWLFAVHHNHLPVIITDDYPHKKRNTSLKTYLLIYLTGKRLPFSNKSHSV